MNLGDWPLVRKTDSQIPILSWCGSDDTSDIVMPTYDLTEATLETMGRLVIVQPTPWGEGGGNLPIRTTHPFTLFSAALRQSSVFVICSLLSRYILFSFPWLLFF